MKISGNDFLKSMLKTVSGSSSRRIGFSKMMSSWFGFSKRGLDLALRAEKITSYPIGPSRLNVDQDDNLIPEDRIDSLLCYPMCIDLEATPMEIEALDPCKVGLARERHRADLLSHAARVACAVDGFGLNALAIVQGYEPFNAIMRELGIQRGLEVIAFENTSLSERLVWDDHSAITTNRNLARNFYWRYIEVSEPDVANEFCTRFIAETKLKKSKEHASPMKCYNSPNFNRPTVVFIGQVYTDSSVIFGIGKWGTPVHLIRELAHLAVKLDFNLWIKLHPKEANGCSPVVNKPYAKLTMRKLNDDLDFQQIAADRSRLMIDHDNTYDTYDLISKANAIVTLNSQAGLEAAIRGVPVVLAGTAFYGGLGFSLDADCPELMELQVARALGIDHDQRMELRTSSRIFTQIYFERYCIPKNPSSIAGLISKRCF